jgi:hypothetical protein
MTAPDTLLALAVNVADGWMPIASYGRHPHRAGLQVFDRAAAFDMQLAHNAARARRADFAGIPVYKGHPDSPALAQTPGHDDTTQYGRITTLDARADALYGRIVWTPGYDPAAEPGKLYVSPGWAFRKNADATISPVKLLSVGIVPDPNIADAPAVNSDPSSPADTGTTKTNMNKEAIIALLSALGITVPADATEEQINTALGQAAGKAKELSDAKTAGEADHAKAATDLAAANSAAETARTATATERAAHVKTILDRAISDGLITVSERGAWNARLTLAGDLQATYGELVAKAPALKTRSELPAAAAHNAAEHADTARAAKIRNRAEEIQKTSPALSWSAAWDRAEAETK